MKSTTNLRVRICRTFVMLGEDGEDLNNFESELKFLQTSFMDENWAMNALVGGDATQDAGNLLDL
ncbi:hypothetical protein AKJ16_DCAP23347 [Drosera capensis]